MKKNKNWLALILGLVLLLGLGQAAQAILPPPPTNPGPPNPNTTLTTFGVPLWYQDSNDLRLELCLPNAAEQAAGACINAPVPVFPIVFPTNFPDESFWFAATPNLLVVPAGGALAGDGQAGLVLALEFAFATGAEIVDGQQIVFGRLRYRIDVQEAGTFTVSTPYGVFNEVVTTPGIGAINVSRDIGVNPGVYTGALLSDIGPFLRASNIPGGAPLDFFDGSALRPGALYLSPPGAVGPVTNGLAGINVFSVAGPNIGGPGINLIQTDQFSLQGRVFNGRVPTSLSGLRATYSRPVVGTGFVDVLANSAATASLTIAEDGQIPFTPMLTDPGTGRFTARITLAPSSTALPASLAVTATIPSNPLNDPTTLGAILTDLVTVTSAEHDPFTRTLTIQAASSDEVSPPDLTAVGYGPLVSGKITVNNVVAHPAVITVTSSKGGSGTRDIISVDAVSGARASYCRPATGNGLVTVFATSSPTATLSISDSTGRIPPTIMDKDPNSGAFFADIPLIPTGSTTLPAGLTITAKSPNPAIASVDVGVALVDVVTITLGEYVPLNKTLTIQATSCDALAPPVLTADVFGNLPSGYLIVNNVNAPPSVLTVNSAAGGSDNKDVTSGSLKRYLPAITKP